MNQAADSELGQGFSTYGVITAERILLDKYKIKLSPQELVEAIKSPFSLYRRILQIPLKNVLNGIILQQANDYHVYIQKLFVDYLLSGEGAQEDTQGTATREEIEQKRLLLMTIGNDFHQAQGKHSLLIAESQSALIKITKSLNEEFEKALTLLHSLFEGRISEPQNTIRKAINHALIYCNMSNKSEKNKYEFVEQMNEILKIPLTDENKQQMIEILSLIAQIERDFDNKRGQFVKLGLEINQAANSFRSQFYEIILRVSHLMKLLPNYKIDLVQDAINREPLYFDRSIGAL